MSTLQRLNILLVESDREKAEAVTGVLDAESYAISHVTSCGLRLLKEVERFQPDLIVMDIESPDRDIIESLNQISDINPKPVVMFSEQGDADTINAMIKSGVSAYIVGDVDPTRVKTIIDVAVARFKEHQQLRSELAQTKELLSSQKTIEQAKIWLMENKQLSEKEAYHQMRKMAMDNSQKMEQVAKNILSFVSMLKL